jgi:hypothetical protein
MAILGELDRAGLIHRDCPPCTARPWAARCNRLGRDAGARRVGVRVLQGRARRRADPGGLLAGPALPELDLDRANGCLRDKAHAYSQDGGLAVLYGNLALDGCIVKTAGVDASILKFTGPARIFESQDAAVEGILADRDQGRRCPGDPLRRPARRAGHAGDALPDLVPEIEGPGQGLRADHRRPLLGRHLGPEHRPRLAGSGRGRPDRPGRRKATASRSTSPIAASASRSPMTNWPGGAAPWRRAAPRPGSRKTVIAR